MATTPGSSLEFTGPAQRLTATGIAAACTILGVGEAELRAVLQVETLGSGFLPDGRPKILFERHVFERLTKGRFSAGHPDLSNKESGGYARGLTLAARGIAEYERLRRAIALDRKTALDSASWGLGQIMGFNAAMAGYDDAAAMAAAFAQGEDEQVAAVARFIVAGKAQRHLAAHDWEAFARFYNGAGFRKYAYDEKLRDAYAALSGDGASGDVLDRA